MISIDSIQLDGSVQKQCKVESVIDRVNNGELVVWRQGMQDLKVMDQARDLVWIVSGRVCGDAGRLRAGSQGMGVEVYSSGTIRV